jgi:hypothetical protein
VGEDLRPHPSTTLWFDLVTGLLGPLVLILAVMASPLNGRWKIVGFGSWAIALFALRNVVFPALVRLAYRRSWTRMLIFPYGAADPDSAVTILHALSWGFGIVGVVMVVVGAMNP